MKFWDSKEVLEMVISIFVIALILSLPLIHEFTLYLLITVFAFALHEIAHKFTAIKLGYFAKYKANFKYLGLSLVVSALFSFTSFPLKFVIPGAVLIYGYRYNLTRKNVAWISLAGPLTNLLIALIFLGLPFSFASLMVRVNAFLAFFNLLPIPPLDGSKIFEWKPWLAILLLFISLLLWYI